MKSKPASAWERFYKDKAGNIVLWQVPNAAVWGWMGCLVVSALLAPGQLRAGFGLLGSALLFTWAYLEVTSGATYFRRLLGAVVMAVIVHGFFAR
jgi:hypothetical protein